MRQTLLILYYFIKRPKLLIMFNTETFNVTVKQRQIVYCCTKYNILTTIIFLKADTKTFCKVVVKSYFK